MYQEPNNPVSVAWMYARVNDDGTMNVARVETSQSMTAQEIKDLIIGETLVVKNAGTIYKHLRTFFPEINKDNQPCKKIIGVTSSYTTDDNRPEGMTLIPFQSILSELNLDFKSIADFSKRRGLFVPSLGVCDSVIFLALILEKDMINRIKMWEDRKPAGRKVRR
jgi:hypothetical protein